MADIINIAPQAGLPDLLLGPVQAAAGLLTADDPSVAALFGSPAWGIYQGGAPIIVADTVLDLGYTGQSVISDYQQEQGAFASYDKVQQPFEARVRFASGGSADVREALLESIEAIVGDLAFYDICTPEKVYTSANVIRHEYRRAAQEGGGSLLVIDVTLQEVRVVLGSSMNNTADPASADAVNLGTVQTVNASTAQRNAAGIGSDTAASNSAASGFSNDYTGSGGHAI